MIWTFMRNEGQDHPDDARGDTPMGFLGRETDRLFEQSSNAEKDVALDGSGDWVPPLDVTGTATELTVMVEVPGVEPKDLDITILYSHNLERRAYISTGPELLSKYTASDSGTVVFDHVVGKPVDEVSVDHNPFWHYLLQTWYKAPQYRKLLHPRVIGKKRSEIYKRR